MYTIFQVHDTSKSLSVIYRVTSQGKYIINMRLLYFRRSIKYDKGVSGDFHT